MMPLRLFWRPLVSGAPYGVSLSLGSPQDPDWGPPTVVELRTSECVGLRGQPSWFSCLTDQETETTSLRGRALSRSGVQIIFSAGLSSPQTTSRARLQTSWPTSDTIQPSTELQRYAADLKQLRTTGHGLHPDPSHPKASSHN